MCASLTNTLDRMLTLLSADISQGPRAQSDYPVPKQQALAVVLQPELSLKRKCN